MRCQITIALTLALLQPLGGVVRFTDNIHLHGSSEENPKPDIQLTIHVTKQLSCSGNRDAYTEIFDVVIRYLNKGTKDLTIYTGEDYSAVEKVAKTLADMQVEKYEVVSNGDMFFTDSTGEHLIGTHPRPYPPKVLAPGQAAESSTGFAIVMRREGANVPMSVLPGTYYVRLGIMTKVTDAPPPSEMNSDPGAKHSFHWTLVMSEPIRVDLPANPVLKDCDEAPKATHP